MPDTNAAVAYITATVTSFHKVGGDHSFSKADIELQAGGPATVTQPDGTNGAIVVNVPAQTSVQIQFSVLDGTGGKTPLTFVPVGIGFKDGTSGDPDGLATFPMRQVSFDDTSKQTVLLISDVVTATTDFAFGLVIQQLDTGGLSIIDPMLTNQTK